MHLPPLLCHSEHAAFLGGSFDPLCLPLLFPGGVKFFLLNGLILHRMSAVKQYFEIQLMLFFFLQSLSFPLPYSLPRTGFGQETPLSLQKTPHKAIEDILIGDCRKNNKIKWCATGGGESSRKQWPCLPDEKEFACLGKGGRERDLWVRSREDICTLSGSALSIMVSVLRITTMIALGITAANCYRTLTVGQALPLYFELPRFALTTP